MTLKRPAELWQEYCDVAPGIRERYGVASALRYVVGEKLMMFAQTAETDEGARTRHCVRLFRIIDALKITSMLPGIDNIIDEVLNGSRSHRSRSHVQYVRFFRRN
jgi:hypothetical protein